MTEAVLSETLGNIDRIAEEVTDLVEITKGSLAIANINEKTIARNFVEFCTGLVERACSEL